MGLFLALWGVAFLGITVDVLQYEAWGLLNLLLFFVLLSFLIVLHELGHTLGAWLMRIRVFRIDIGLGLTLFDGKRWGLRREPGALSGFAGIVIPGFPTTRFFRTRYTVMTACGPLVNAVLLAVSLWWLSPTVFFGSLGDLDSRLLFGTTFALVNATMLTFSLLPLRSGVYRGMPLRNDAFILLSIPFFSKETEQQTHRAYFLQEANVCVEHGDADGVTQWLERSLEAYPDDPFVLAWMASSCLRNRDFVQSRQTVRKLLSRPDLTPIVRQYLFDLLASTDLLLLLDGTRAIQDIETNGCVELIPPTDLLEEASRAVDEALPLARQTPQIVVSVLATRGAVLIEQGKSEEGTALLQGALDAAETKHDKAVCHSYLGLASLRKDDPEGCRQHLETARGLSPECVCLEGVSRQLERALPDVAMVGAIE
jgi:hypothetical protein